MAASVLVIIYAVIFKPISGSLEERDRVVALGCPVAGIIGAVIGAVIVRRDEKDELK